MDSGKQFSDFRAQLCGLDPDYSTKLLMIPGGPKILSHDIFVTDLLTNSIERRLRDAGLKGFLVKLLSCNGYLFFPAPGLKTAVAVLILDSGDNRSQIEMEQVLLDLLMADPLLKRAKEKHVISFAMMVAKNNGQQEQSAIFFSINEESQRQLKFDPKNEKMIIARSPGSKQKHIVQQLQRSSAMTTKLLETFFDHVDETIGRCFGK